MLIPGFLAGDLSLGPLAGRLRELGCRVFFPGLWCNVDCPIHTMPHLEKVLRKANHKTSGQVIQPFANLARVSLRRERTQPYQASDEGRAPRQRLMI
jgi:hypothetical protein